MNTREGGTVTRLRLYDYFASCNCYKVRLLLAQLGLEYERVPVDIFNGDTHRAHEAHIDMGPYANLRAWFARVESQPGFIEDVEPYGANAAPGAGRSIYD